MISKINDNQLIFIITSFEGGPSFLLKELIKDDNYSQKKFLILVRAKNFDDNIKVFLKKNKICLIKGLKNIFTFLIKSIIIDLSKFFLFIKKTPKKTLISFDNLSNIVCFFIKLFLKVDWIITLHGFQAPIAKKYKFINSLIFRYANKITTNSNALNSHIKDFFPFTDPITIPLGINKKYSNFKKSIIKSKKIKEENIGLIHLANFYSKIKSQDTSIFLSQHLKKNGIKHTLNFVGDGKFKNINKELVDNLNLNDCIKFHGYLSNSKKFRIIENNHICLMPSKNESFGIASLECMSYGLPVIASNVKGQNELVIDGFNGLLFDVSDINDLFIKIKEIIMDNQLYLKLSYGAIETAAQFTSKKMVESYKKLYFN